MRLKLKGRKGRRGRTWDFFLLWLLFFILSKRENCYHFTESTGGWRVEGPACKRISTLTAFFRAIQDCSHYIPPASKNSDQPHSTEEKGEAQKSQVQPVTDRSDFLLPSSLLSAYQIYSKCLYKCFSESYLHALDWQDQLPTDNAK